MMPTFFENCIVMAIHEGLWLKKAVREKGWRQEDFAEMLGISRNHLITLMKEVELPDKYRGAICDKLGVTEPEMIEQASTVAEEPTMPYNASERDRGGRDNAWWIPVKAQAGFLRGFQRRVFSSSITRSSLPIIAGECFCFEIEGFSMYPDYVPGAYVACTILPDWNLDMRVGTTYVFQTDDGICIKNFAGFDGSLILLKSANANYNPVIPLHLEEVRQVYNIELVLTKPGTPRGL